MPNYAQEIFEEKTTPSEKTDYAGDIFGGVTAVPSHEPYTGPKVVPVERHYEETDEISAITGKPITKFTGRGGPGASMRAHTRAGWVDNPLVKFDIYSKDRFPNMSLEERAKRYKWQNGELIFQAENGKWYSENPDMAIYKLKKMIAQQPAHLPSEFLGMWGAFTGGFPGAFVGSLTGEGVRKAVGMLALQDQQTTDEILTDLVTAGLLGGTGEIIGARLTGIGRKVLPLKGGRKGRKITSLMKRDAIFIDFEKAARIQRIAEQKYGIRLWDAQTTESRRLIDRLNIYGDLPETADLVQIAKRMQDEQAYRATKIFFDDIAPTTDALYAGESISKEAQRAIERKIGQRLGKAKPHYDRAFAQNTEIDITPHIQELDDLIAESLLNGPRRKKLLQFRAMLFKKEKKNVKELVPTDMLDRFGNPVMKTVEKTKTELVPETHIKKLDELKKSVDVILEPRVGDKPIDNTTKKNIREIKNNILADLDVANPDYARARKIWGDDSEAIKELTNRTLLKDIADLEGDDVVNASRILLRTVGNSPERMLKVKNQIYPENPRVWNAIVRVHLEDVMGRVSKDAGGNAAKAFNAFWRNTVGTPNQAKILKVAMDDKYKTLETFADILRRAALIVRKESTTATRQEILAEEGEGLVMGLIRSSFYPLVTKRKVAYQKARLLLTAENRKKTAKALLTPTAAKRLARIKTLGMDSERGIRAFTTFLALLYGNHFTETNEIIFKEK